MRCIHAASWLRVRAAMRCCVRQARAWATSPLSRSRSALRSSLSLHIRSSSQIPSSTQLARLSTPCVTPLLPPAPLQRSSWCRSRRFCFPVRQPASCGTPRANPPADAASASAAGPAAADATAVHAAAAADDAARPVPAGVPARPAAGADAEPTKRRGICCTGCRKKSGSGKKTGLIALCAALAVVVLAAAGIFFFNQYPGWNDDESNLAEAYPGLLGSRSAPPATAIPSATTASRRKASWRRSPVRATT